jgi:DNA-binding MarR family transcriptional regulator
MSRADGRVAIFRLTRKGRRRFAGIADQHRRWVADAFSSMSPAQIAAFRALLARVSAADARKDAA